MTIETLLKELSSEIDVLLSSDFDIEVIETDRVPNIDDSDLTYDNFDRKIKKCKVIDTCVLYIDIRKSTALNISHRPQTLTKLYSSFIRSMVKAVEYFDGYVRNIVGDRIMVVFNSFNCFSNAVNTAILLNTIGNHIIDDKFKLNDIKLGVGIDYGKMMVVKAGTIKQGQENQFYRSLVWLGKPANIASKLTDVANKVDIDWGDKVMAGYHYPLADKWSWVSVDPIKFIKDLEVTYSPVIKHKNEYFSSFFLTKEDEINSTPQILITENVYEGFCEEQPTAPSIINNWWNPQNISIPEYKGKIYGANTFFNCVKKI